VVLAPNHVSIVDSIILANVVPRQITFIAKASTSTMALGWPFG